MDFTNLEGMISNDIKLTPEEKHLRRSLYIVFANTRLVEKLYTDVLARFKKYINTNLLQQKYNEDILYSFFKRVKYASTMKEQDKVNLNVQVYSCPFLPFINIAPSLKSSQQVVTKMNKIGYQHLYMLSTKTDTSESSNTSDSDLGSGDDVPLTKKLKTCQEAIYVNCESMLDLHFENTTKVTGANVHVDILIFMDKSFCKQLSDYLGLIYVEEILNKVAEEKDLNDVLFRLNNKSAKWYRLIQSFINKQLIKGYNNICLVHHLSLWKNFNANVRAIISTKGKECNISHMEAVETSNFHVKLGEHQSILDYVEAISIIIDKALHCKSYVIGKYECDKDLYRNVKLPLISIIPLHVLRYFSHCKILEQETDLH